MKDILDFFLTLLRQFAGGPGPVENNLVRFGLAGIFWAVLFTIAWSRQRSGELPRERLLVWGFGLALLREIYMFGQIAGRVISNNQIEASCNVTEPVEHALAMVAVVVVAGAFLRYKLDDVVLSRLYLQVGLGIAMLSLLATALIWPPWLANTPGLKFHQTWLAWLFHLPLSLMILSAIFFLWKKPGWLRNVVTSALMLFFLSEVLFLLNYSTERAYAVFLCPLGNSFHILAIPLLGFVYLREQGLEKEQAESDLRTYRDHLQDLVTERTAELTHVNERLQQEVFERRLAEEALARITQRDELILTSAGEGICGIDCQGFFTFVNPAAATMLGYKTDELVNQSCHSIWHSHRSDGTPYPEESCPIYAGYHLGIAYNGDDEYFCRKDGTLFPVRYFSNPTYEKGILSGAVVVFQDITERKRNEMEIARRNASLAIQNAVAAALSQSLDIQISLKSALEMLLERLSMHVGIIFLMDTRQKILASLLYSGLSSEKEFQTLTDKTSTCWKISNQALTQTRALTFSRLDDANGYESLHCLVSTPLISKGQAIGVMTLGSFHPESIGQYDLDLLTAVGQQMGMAIENARMFQDAELWAADLNRLQEISAHLVSSFDEHHILTLVIEQSIRLLDCQMAFAFHLDQENSRLVVAASSGMSLEQEQVIIESLNVARLFAGLVDSPRLININNTQDDAQLPGSWRSSLGVRAFLCVPVWGADQPLMYLGVLDVEQPRFWKPQELELMESFAARAAVALMNARLHKQLEMAAALEERQRIAADMHDGLAQTLGLLGLHVDQVSERVTEGSDQDAAADLQAMREVVTQASAEVRRSIASLRGAPKPRLSLQVQLSQMAERQSVSGQPQIEFVNRLSQPLFLSKDQSEQVFPLLQEAVLNAQNHAHATTIRVVLEALGEDVQASVDDDGVGFNPNATADIGDHFGLSIMQARAGRIGGQLVILSSPECGTSVKMTWRPATEEEPRHKASAIERQVSKNE